MGPSYAIISPPGGLLLHDHFHRLHGVFTDFLSKLPGTERDRSIKAAWLLVMCIDCRYPHVVHNYMRREHPCELYDQLVLAGASLAAVDADGQHQNWMETFLEHVKLSIGLHEIDGVLILDHRTCGAYREFHLLTVEHENTPYETDRHREVATRAASYVIDVFNAEGRAGICDVWLVPEVTDPEADDFPCVPERLVTLHT